MISPKVQMREGCLFQPVFLESGEGSVVHGVLIISRLDEARLDEMLTVDTAEVFDEVDIEKFREFVEYITN